MTRDGRNGTADFSGQGAATHGGRGGEDAADAVARAVTMQRHTDRARGSDLK